MAFTPATVVTLYICSVCNTGVAEFEADVHPQNVSFCSTIKSLLCNWCPLIRIQMGFKYLYSVYLFWKYLTTNLSPRPPYHQSSVLSKSLTIQPKPLETVRICNSGQLSIQSEQPNATSKFCPFGGFSFITVLQATPEQGFYVTEIQFHNHP